MREIWRYPVKSMAGERLEEAALDPGGIPGDRAWAVRDERRGGIRGAKKIPGLMRCAARYREPPTRDRVGAPEITLPDGGRVEADAADVSERLSIALESMMFSSLNLIANSNNGTRIAREAFSRCRSHHSGRRHGGARSTSRGHDLLSRKSLLAFPRSWPRTPGL